jgi:hypothetical protein
VRKLSPARHRELHHARLNQVAWRYNWHDDYWYPWCRLCGRRPDKQIDWLIEAGYIEGVSGSSAPVNALVIPAVAGPYLERYPR